MSERARQLSEGQISFFTTNGKGRNSGDRFFARVEKVVEIQKGNPNLIVSVLDPDFGSIKKRLSLGGGTKVTYI